MCHRWGITLCGGHTEITDAVTRPVASGMLVGTLEESRLIRKQNIKPDLENQELSPIALMRHRIEEMNRKLLK